MLSTIMVVGLGSMGSRRLRLLRALRPELRLCGVDMDKERCQRAEEAFHIAAYPSISQAIQAEQPEAAVVSTAPLSHAGIIHQCLEAGLHVFTELNLVPDGYTENMALAAERRRVLFMSSTFLYREETRYLIDRCGSYCGALNYRYHVGQYLPDWHPWENYRNYFVGDARTSGCREILAIELPWLCAAFGPIADIQCIHGKSSGLHIPYDDSFMLLLRHEGGHMGSLCVDVVSRRASRQFEAYGENLYLTWQGDPDSLYDWDIEKKENRRIRPYEGGAHHQQGYAGFIIENAYTEELSAFLAQIEQGTVPPYGFEDDLTTLRWIDRIEGRNSP